MTTSLPSVGVDHLFHSRYTNNFSVVLANRSFDLDVLQTTRRTLLEHLNQASYALEGFIASRLDDDAFVQLMPSEQRQVLTQLCQNWQLQIEMGNSFLTYDYAEVCVALLAEINYPITEYLHDDRYRHIAQQFVTIPMPCKAFVRINSYVSFGETQTALDRLLAQFANQPGLFRYIERVEIARTDFPLTLETGETDYPTFSLFLDQQRIQTRHHPLIGELVELVEAVMDGLTQRIPQTDYSHAIRPNLTVSQGYRNYKKYLHLLGLLDTVYDQDSNYAYLI